MTGPDPRKAALYRQYAMMYPNETDEQLESRVERLGLSAVDRPIDPASRLAKLPLTRPEPLMRNPDAGKAKMMQEFASIYPDESDRQLEQRTELFFNTEKIRNRDKIAPYIPGGELDRPDPMTIGAASSGNIAKREARKLFGEGAVGGKLGDLTQGLVGGVAGTIGKYGDDPVEAAKSDVAAIATMATSLPMVMARDLIANPLQLGLDAALGDYYNLTDKERIEKGEQFLLTAASMYIGGKLVQSPSLTRFRNTAGDIMSTAKVPSIKTLAKEIIPRSIGQSVAIGAAQAGIESKSSDEFGQKFYSYAISTLPFALALDVGFTARAIPKIIEEHGQVRQAAQETHRIGMIHDVARDINETRDAMVSLQNIKDQLVAAGKEVSPDMQYDIDRYQRTITYLEDVAQKSIDFNYDAGGDNPLTLALNLPSKRKEAPAWDKGISPNVREGELNKPANIRPLVKEIGSAKEITQSHVDAINSLSDDAKMQLGALHRELEIENQRKTITPERLKLFNKLEDLQALREEPQLKEDEAKFLEQHPSWRPKSTVGTPEADPVQAQLAALKEKVAKEGVPERRAPLEKMTLREVTSQGVGRFGTFDEPSVDVIHEGETYKLTNEMVIAELERRIGELKNERVEAKHGNNTNEVNRIDQDLTWANERLESHKQRLKDRTEYQAREAKRNAEIAEHEAAEAKREAEHRARMDELSGKTAPVVTMRHGTDPQAAIGIINEGLRKGSSVDVGSGLSGNESVIFELEQSPTRPYDPGDISSEGSATTQSVNKKIRRVFFDAHDYTREDATTIYNELRKALDESGRKDVKIEAATYNADTDKWTYGGDVKLDKVKSHAEELKTLSNKQLTQEYYNAMDNLDSYFDADESTLNPTERFRKAQAEAAFDRVVKEIESRPDHPDFYEGDDLKSATIQKDVVTPEVPTGEHVKTWSVEEKPNGEVVVGSEANPERFTFDNKADANEFLNLSKKPPVDFDIPTPPGQPPLTGGPTPPQPVSPKPHEAAWSPRPQGKFAKKLAAWTNVLRAVTNRVGIFGQNDNLFGTMIVPRVYEGPGWIKQKADQAKKVWINIINKMLIPEANKLTGERLKVVGQHRESYGIEDIVTGFRDKRKINDVDRATVTMMMDQVFGKKINPADVTITPTELASARIIADAGSDIERSISIAGTLRDIAKAYEKKKAVILSAQGGNQFSTKNALKNLETQMRQERDVMLFDTKASSQVIKAALEIESIVNAGKPSSLSYHAVTLMADAIQSKKMNRAEFAVANKMTPEEIRLSDEIRTIQNTITQTSKDTDVNLLNSLVAHHNKFGRTPKALRNGIEPTGGTGRHFDAVKNNNYDLDNPINNLLNHTNATINKNHGLQAAVARAEKALEEETAKIPNQLIANAIRKEGRQYLAEIMGSVNPEVAVTNAYLSELGSQLGVPVDKGKLNDFVSLAITGYSGVKLGGRVGLVARDIGQGVNNYYIRFEANLLRYLDGNIFKRMKQLREAGITPTMSGSYHFSGTEADLQAVARMGKGIKNFIEKGAEVGLYASGQEFVFELIHSLAYLDRMDVVGKGLLDLQKGKTTKAKLYPELKMHTYHESVQKKFDQLVSIEDYDGAAKYIAQKTSNEHGVVYGYAGLPTQWRSTIGRVMGQFNTFTTWQRSLYTQILQSAQSPKEAAAIAGRIALTQAAVVGSSYLLGMKAGPWMIHQGFLPQLGPMVATYQDWMDPTETTDFNDPGDIAEKAVRQIGFAADIFKGIEANEQGFNPVTTAMRFMAFPMDKTERSLLDVMMGYYPQLAAKRGAMNSVLNMITK